MLICNIILFLLYDAMLICNIKLFLLHENFKHYS
jgi:hypothetical protein